MCCLAAVHGSKYCRRSCTVAAACVGAHIFSPSWPKCSLGPSFLCQPPFLLLMLLLCLVILRISHRACPAGIMQHVEVAPGCCMWCSTHALSSMSD